VLTLIAFSKFVCYNSFDARKYRGLVLEHSKKVAWVNREKKVELLQFVLLCIGVIRERFEPVKSSEDFLKDSEGFMRLDAIAMRLFQVGEAMKNIYDIDRQTLLRIEESDYWIKVISIRELFVNSNIELDSDIIFNICNNKLDKIEKSVLDYLNILTIRDRY
jgi:uncharacterized protein with HEPN domain